MNPVYSPVQPGAPYGNPKNMAYTGETHTQHAHNTQHMEKRVPSPLPEKSVTNVPVFSVGTLVQCHMLLPLSRLPCRVPDGRPHLHPQPLPDRQPWISPR